MTNPILIVGGGPAGLAASHALASVGQASVLVEKEDRLGGAPILTGYAKLVPTGEWAKDAIGGMVKRVEDHPLVTVHTDATIESFEGESGAFSAKLSSGESVDASAAILCTGFTHFDSVNKPEWGFGTYPDVVTTSQIEQMISSGKGVRCPSDDRKPKRVAILLCVGSRDRQIGREWCSKICCTVSANIAMEIREELPDCHVYIYYMDIRTFGLYETKYYWKSQEEFKVKYIKARIAEVTSDGDKLIVKGEDTLVKRPITIPFDMVVHAIGMDPNVDNPDISSVFGIDLETHGFIADSHTYGVIGETTRPGVFVAGSATGPETIDDSIAQGDRPGQCRCDVSAGPCAGSVRRGFGVAVPAKWPRFSLKKIRPRSSPTDRCLT
jgi:heterodisulfide reductase subunit A